MMGMKAPDHPTLMNKWKYNRAIHPKLDVILSYLQNTNIVISFLKTERIRFTLDAQVGMAFITEIMPNFQHG